MNVEAIQSQTDWTLFSRPPEIGQRPVTGLDLEPMNFIVMVYSGLIDMGMHSVYNQGRVRIPAVGLS